jgi:hypothetical protein
MDSIDICNLNWDICHTRVTAEIDTPLDPFGRSTVAMRMLIGMIGIRANIVSTIKTEMAQDRDGESKWIEDLTSWP